MRLFVYEHVTGGGLLGAASPRESPLFVEAASIVAAATHDLHRLPDAEGVLLVDGRLRFETPGDRRTAIRAVDSRVAWEAAFDEAVRSADYTLLIAPETAGTLVALARRVETLGGRLLSPSSRFCDWATDKSRVARTLTDLRAAPVGRCLRFDAPWPGDVPLPAVLKPNDGCGSDSVRLIRTVADDARTALHEFWRLEEFIPGQAASVPLIRGPRQTMMLVPCLQHLADDGTFAYQGGSAPLHREQSQRVAGLVNRCLESLPDFCGYIGIDVVLGTASDGTDDRIIEVNPRLTTSYHAQHALVRNNLIGVMIDLAEGREATLDYRAGYVDFTPEGRTSGVWEADE